MNILFCSAGRRCELVKDFRKSAESGSRIIVADNSCYAPALYFADRQYIVPCIDTPEYIDVILDICQKEQCTAITTFFDPEIELLARNRARFIALGVEVLAPFERTAHLCFDKYEMFQHLTRLSIPTIMTWGSLPAFDAAYSAKKATFPVFVKPRAGSGSVGAHKANSYDELMASVRADPSIIIQELVDGLDLDVDVYVDMKSHEVVSAFAKKKISTTIGGANKTISFKDIRLFELIKRISASLELHGPNDMDFFYKNGQYFLSEINPRFGGAYLHAYGAGVDFIKFIENNLKGQENAPAIGDYEDDVVMMMYDSVVIKKFAKQSSDQSLLRPCDKL